jgi:lipopolysaccharide export system protein LptC
MMHYVPLVVVALLALATWLMVERARLQRSDSDRPNSPMKPDFIVENLRFAKVNQAGELQTLLSAQRMLHIPQTNTATLIEPRMMSFDANSPPVSISARRGESIRQSEQVNFYEGVIVQRAAAANSPEMILRTEQLSVRPDDDMATSETDFTFSRGRSLIQGQGFELNHSFRTLLVRQRARGLFVQGNTP